MSPEFIQEKQQALERVLAAYQVLRERLRELPPEWAAEVLRDLAVRDGQGPTEAVIELLGRHPEGLAAKEIIRRLAPRFRTSSPNPRKVLYSTLACLRKHGRIVRVNRRHFLPSPPAP